MLITALLALSAHAGGTQTKAFDPYKPLTASHTQYGVSMLLAGDVLAGSVQLSNPGPADHTASVLVYQDAQFLGCSNVEVASHDSVEVDTSGFGEDLYVEVVAVPTDDIELRVIRFGQPPIWENSRQVNGFFMTPRYHERTRWADALGIAGGESLELLHPTLFNLPGDAVQKQAATDCMCGAVTGDPGLWSKFGIVCD
jgi:hypothetical protein